LKTREEGRGESLDTGVQLLVGCSYRLRRSQGMSVYHSVLLKILNTGNEMLKKTRDEKFSNAVS